MEGPFIMGDTLPIHVDYLLYACLADIKNFVPNAIGADKHPKIHNFMEKFWTYKYILFNLFDIFIEICLKYQ